MLIFVVGLTVSGKTTICNQIVSGMPNFKYAKNIDHIVDDGNYVVDGIDDPKDFITKFNPKTDYLVVLNRLDYQPDNGNYENISLSVVRDYCYWLMCRKKLNINNWLEFNIKSLKDKDSVKKFSNRNTLFIVSNLNCVYEAINKLLIGDL